MDYSVSLMNGIVSVAGVYGQVYHAATTHITFLNTLPRTVVLWRRSHSKSIAFHFKTITQRWYQIMGTQND